MGFNWTTFVAQIINLFVLVWLMKRFLYGPIIDTISKRQAYIEGKVKKAEQDAKDAQKQEKELQKQMDLWQRDRKKRIDALYAELAALRSEQTERISLEMDGLRQKMQDDLNREMLTRQIEIRSIMAQNFMLLSRKALTDLSGLTPMAQTLSLFKKTVSALSKTEIKNIQKSLKKDENITVSVSEKLTSEEENDLTSFLIGLFGERRVYYIVEPDLILGVETQVGETVLEWNLKTYLDLFDSNLNAALAGLIIKE